MNASQNEFYLDSAGVDGDQKADAFVWHALLGHLDEVKEFLAQGQDPNAKDRHGASALIQAVRFRKPDVVAYLASIRGADPNIGDRHGNTALIAAARNGAAAMATTIGAIPGLNPNLPNDQGSTALMEAVLSADLDCLIAVAAIPGVEINATNGRGKTALSFAEKKGDKEMIAFLKEHGAEPPSPTRRAKELICRFGDLCAPEFSA